MSTKKRRDSKARLSPIHGVLAAAVLGLVVMPIAFAGAASDPGATAAAVSKKKFKKLKQRVNALEGRSTAPSGPAGGDLTGTYPNPTIGPNAVSSNEVALDSLTAVDIAPDAIGASEIATDGVGSAEVASNAVGNSELKGLNPAFSGPTAIAANSSTLITVGCTGGFAVSGGGTWDSTDPDLAISQSFPFLGAWAIRASNQDGAQHSFDALAMCLPN